ncbi:G2/mitotic-specific cyclin S13-7 [Ranunculus cassubicifolius]
MRVILVDWLIEVHNKFELMPETLYLTVHIVDRYLSQKAIPRRNLQLAGMASMFIASKYEEIWAPEVSDFIHISDDAYSREMLLIMEKSILGKLEWSLTVPTLYVFLARYIKAAISDQEVYTREYIHKNSILFHFHVCVSRLIIVYIVHRWRVWCSFWQSCGCLCPGMSPYPL